MDYDVKTSEALLRRLNIPVPATVGAIRQAAYEALKEEDFLDAHCHRLGRHYENFSREDWGEVVEMSGAQKVMGNPGAFTVCLTNGIAAEFEFM